MNTVIESLEQRAIKRRPRFAAGDRVRVHFQVVEGSRRRTQVFEGIVLKRQGSGARETFTVRKNSFGVGVERTFPLHSPKIEKLEVAARGDVRRAKLYYLREKVGKRARVAERRWGIEDEMVIASEEAEAVDAEGVAVAEADAEAEEAEEAAGAESEGSEAAGGEGTGAAPARPGAEQPETAPGGPGEAREREDGEAESEEAGAAEEAADEPEDGAEPRAEKARGSEDAG
jgi:large subunit ribosomal protein L19